MSSYLISGDKKECYACEACVQICSKSAIQMIEDEEGFRYPRIDTAVCVNCKQCEKICLTNDMPRKYEDKQIAFGGYHLDKNIREESTSGGAFSAIVDTWCDQNYVIFGATSEGLDVYHTYVCEKSNMKKFRKSKYSQSKIGNSYNEVKKFLKEEKKVLFSGTPCQIAGLKTYLKNENCENLLTVEVVCEGVPSPLFIRKYDEWMYSKYKSKIKKLDYRYKDGKKWDFEVMSTSLQNGKTFKKDRWFNPFWRIWLGHLMSKPSCYHCPFATEKRVADITLGDLWGVHLYCPELYGNNGGSSLIVCNSEKGRKVLKNAQNKMYGHYLNFEEALKYQSPMRKTISSNPKREEFFEDLRNKDYRYICKKWGGRPTIKLLYSKYIWGNRQKVFLWNLKKRLKKKKSRGEKNA